MDGGLQLEGPGRLEGPGSLTADSNDDSHSDFVVISSEQAEEPEDTSVFDNLSNQDAIAQVKELYVQRNELQQKFVECSGKLEHLNQKLEDQRKEEKTKCDRAKQKVNQLTDENKLKQKQVDDLTMELAKLQVGAPHERMVTSQLVSQETVAHDTQCPSCHPSVADGAERPAVRGTSPTQMDELRQQLQTLQEKERKWREEKESLEDRRNKADVKVIEISGSYENLRQQNIRLESELASKSSEADRLSKRLQDSEKRVQNGLAEANMRYTQEKAELVKRAEEADAKLQDCLHTLERERQDRQQLGQLNVGLRQDNQTLLAIKQGLLRKIADCTAKMQEFLPVKQECNSLRQQVASLRQEASTFRQKEDNQQRTVEAFQQQQASLQQEKNKLDREKSVLDREKTALTHEKAQLTQDLNSCRQDKDQTEKELQLIRQQLTTASQGLERVTREKETLYTEAQSKTQKIIDLQHQITQLEQSVGDEVPQLIQESMDLKEKLREEKKKCETQITEHQKLVSAKDLEMVKKTQQVNQLNAIITNLKQNAANKDGQIIRLQTEIGELNSQNIRHTVAAHRPFQPQQPDIPEAAVEEPPPRPKQTNIVTCPLCDVKGDADYINNHCNRDHFS